MRVVVTGGSGTAGRAVVRELVAHGHRVLNVDLAADPEPVCAFRQADLTEPGQAYEILRRQEAVVHLAAIPRPYLLTDEATFRTNVGSTYNVFAAATDLGLERVVWASSETTLGLPFDSTVTYFPIDEIPSPVAKSIYALSKVVAEEMARYFASKSGIPFIGLRFSNVWAETDYAEVESFQGDARLRSWNAWGWVDTRDVAQACRLSLTAEVTGADVFIIAAIDTVMARTSLILSPRSFPGCRSRATSMVARRCCRSTRPDGSSATNPDIAWPDASSGKENCDDILAYS